MEERIQKELELLGRHWPKLEYRPDCRWVRIPYYSLQKRMESAVHRGGISR